MLPPELIKYANLRFIRKRGVGEFSSECPNCSDSAHLPGSGTPDRFRMFCADGKSNARGWCRRCGFFEWADAGEVKNSLTREEIDSINRMRAVLAKKEAQRLERKITEFNQSQVWKDYNENMGDTGRKLWRDAGIPDNFQDLWSFGFTPERSFSFGENKEVLPAMTIPYILDGIVFNVQYRLVGKAKDKYRFSYGLKPGLWRAIDEPVSGPTLLLEGVKKGAVSFIELVAKANKRYSVIASPSCNLTDVMAKELKNAGPIYIIFDPDARENAERASVTLGEERCRIVSLPDKIDDLIINYGYTSKDILHAIKDARPPRTRRKAM